MKAVWRRRYLDIAETTVEIANGNSIAYTGEALTPEVTVTASNGIVLTKDTDYTVSYANNTEVGTATVTITGKGDWKGTITKNFTITQTE